MCGLFGRFTKFGVLTKQDRENFIKLAFVSMTRGQDAIGVASIGKDLLPDRSSDVSFVKAAVNPGAFFRMKEFQKVLWSPDSKGLFGHVRAATRGDSSDSTNAHPFMSKDGRFLVFHNGTLDNQHEPYGTDSQWLTERIAENNGDLEKALTGVRGAYALVILDIQKATVTLIRNGLRTLFLSSLNGEWAYASEEWFLTGVLGASKNLVSAVGIHEAIEFQLTEAEGGKFNTLQEMRRYKVNPFPTFPVNVSNWRNHNEGTDQKVVVFNPKGPGQSGTTEVNGGEPFGTVTKKGNKASTKNGYTFVDFDKEPWVFKDNEKVYSAAGEGGRQFTFGHLANLFGPEDASILMLIPENFYINYIEEEDASGKKYSTPICVVETFKGSFQELSLFKTLVEFGSALSFETVPFAQNRVWVDGDSYIRKDEIPFYQERENATDH